MTTDSRRDTPTSVERKRRDRRWIHAIVRSGSRRAARSLVETYYNGLFSYVCRQLGDADRAMAVTQESMIAALQSLPSYDPEQGAFSTWLYRIATYKVIDMLRAAHGNRIMPAATVLLVDPEDDQTFDPPDDRVRDMASLMADRDLIARVERRVAGSDPPVQQIYRLHLYAGLSFAEIAQMTNDPESTVKTRYYRLLAGLRKEFSDERR